LQKTRAKSVKVWNKNVPSIRGFKPHGVPGEARHTRQGAPEELGAGKHNSKHREERKEGRKELID